MRQTCVQGTGCATDLGKKVKTKDVLEIGAFPVVDQGKVLVRGFSDDRDKVIRVERPLVLLAIIREKPS